MTHASQLWAKAMSANLWPYALRIANNEWNHAPNPRKRKDIEAPFSRSTVPMSRGMLSKAYRELQQKVPFYKWRGKARMGVYWGQSPVYTRKSPGARCRKGICGPTVSLFP